MCRLGRGKKNIAPSFFLVCFHFFIFVLFFNFFHRFFFLFSFVFHFFILYSFIFLLENVSSFCILFLFFLFSGAQNLWRHSRIRMGKVQKSELALVALYWLVGTFHCGIVHILVMFRLRVVYGGRRVGQVLPWYQESPD